MKSEKDEIKNRVKGLTARALCMGPSLQQQQQLPSLHVRPSIASKFFFDA